jgi:sugar phosphate isomerase/epimerase
LKTGLSTWCFLEEDVYTAVKTVGGAGFKEVELWGEVPHAYHEWVDASRLGDCLSSYDLEVTLHAPFTDLNPASPFQPVNDAVTRTLRDFVSFGARIGAVRITVHPGSVHNKALVARSVESSVGTLRAVVKEADGRLEINIENQARSQSPYHFPLGSNYESVDVLLSEVEGSHLTLDTGHAMVAGIDPIQHFDRFRDEITEIHLSDNKGVHDDHLIPGPGTSWLPDLLGRVANSDVFVCLELNPHTLSKDEILSAARAIETHR